MPKPVDCSKKSATGKTPAKKKPVVRFIHMRVENGCPKCGGMLDISVRLEGGGSLDCLTCRIYSTISFTEAIKYLSDCK